uniref:BRK domain-containing protein n=1 Tax=Erpetoichthys calabaricus TaxID=27687 RepID=A0A8C4SRV2_ERPCA
MFFILDLLYIWIPELDHSELPAKWWDKDADKCLLLGVFKHGYEKYNTIRADPALSFLERVGKPDEKAIAAEQRACDFMDGDVDDPEYKPAPALLKDDIEDDASSPGDLVIADNAHIMEGDAMYWPPSSALTTRLRRLITTYQRNTKNRQIQQIQQVYLAQQCLQTPVCEETITPKMAAKIERQQRWTRREEADFYRVVSTFGVVFDPEASRFDWTKFRAMARLHKKTDDSLQKYLCAFTAMCRRVCRLPPKEGGIMKGFDEDSVASLSTTQDETQDSFVMDNGIPNSSPMFHGGYMLAASFWPKDRVMINRLDSICQAILKGKWPTVRRTYDCNAVASFYTTKLLDSPTAAANLSDSRVGTPPLPGLREDPSVSPQMLKVKKHVQQEKEFTVKINDEGGLKLTFQKQGLPQKRPFETDDIPMGQQQYLARLRELQSASDASLADFTKPLASSGIYFHKENILEPPMAKRRRGRRKNVEGIDLLFLNKNKVSLNNVGSTLQVSPSMLYCQGQGTLDMESRIPVINLKDGTRLAGDDAPKRKDLDQWLKGHPGYVADVGAFIPVNGQPKQKRHRCRNPNKIDVNSLTGDERVQVINRRNARKVGGAFAPPLKDICRFLQENPEYGIPPEWADVVKNSGFLPESMFDRILTGPVVREEVSRRGRRPKSEIAKAAAAASAANTPILGVNPLLANGLLPGMDLSSLQALQQNLQSLQSLQLTAGLMGLPAGLASGDANNLATMFPMMLSGMAGLPNLLGLGSLLTKSSETLTSEDTKGNGANESSKLSSDMKNERTEGQSAEPCSGEPSASNSPSTSMSTSLNASAVAAAAVTGSHSLALNPLLISSMLYPGMLLTPGLNLPIPALSQSNLFDVQKSVNSDSTLASVSEETVEEVKREHRAEQAETVMPTPDICADDGSDKDVSSSESQSSSSSSSDDSDSSDSD